jgi:hypothetical protein
MFAPITRFERLEWGRMADAIESRAPALAERLRLCIAADLVPQATFDDLANRYRAWLTFDEVTDVQT